MAEKEPLSPARKALKVISWLIIAFSILYFVLGVGLFSLGIYALGGQEQAKQLQLEQEDQFTALFVIAVLAIFMGLVIFIIGLLGMRGAKNPRKIMPFIIVSVVEVIGSFYGIVTSIMGDLNEVVILSQFIQLIPSLVCLIVASIVRKQREDLPGSELAGPDGPEFKDGFNPKKLGFMRIIQICLAVNIAVTLLSLTLLVKGNYELSFADLLGLLDLIFNGILFWLIWQRSNITRPVAIGFSLFNILVGTGYNLAIDSFSFTSQLTLCVFDIIVLFYFLFSRRVKAILDKPFSIERVHKRIEEEKRIFYNLKSWPFWRSLIIYFCLFSIVGHWMEAGLCLLIKYGIVPGIYDPNSQIWSDWLYPFPVYGFGTVACILLLYPIKNFLQKKFKNWWAPLILSFIINTLVCTAIELTLGLIQNQPVNGVYPLWDYSNMFCNFMGQVCLQNSLAFGAVATLMTWIVYPGLEKLMSKVPNNIANIIFIVVVIFFAICMCLYCIKFTSPDFDVSS